MADSNARWGLDASQVWIAIAPDGRIEFLDWDVAERLVEMHRAGARRDMVTAVAVLAIGIREMVLAPAAPAIPHSGGRPSNREDTP